MFAAGCRKHSKVSTRMAQFFVSVGVYMCVLTILTYDCICRYIPVGVLERVPQKINERPPTFVGRDELETLMASNNCQDWIKIRYFSHTM